MSVYKPYKNKQYFEQNQKILLRKLSSKFKDFSADSIKEELKNLDILVLEELSLILTGKNNLNTTSEIAEEMLRIGYDEFHAKLKTYNDEVIEQTVFDAPGIFHGDMKQYLVRLGGLAKKWAPEVVYPTFAQLLQNAAKVVITIIVFGTCCVLVDSIYEVILKKVFGILIKHTGALTVFDEINL